MISNNTSLNTTHIPRCFIFFMSLLSLIYVSALFAQEIDRSGNQYILTRCDSTRWLCREEPWVLIFEDEFNGDVLNEDNWDIYIGVPRDPYFDKQKAWHQKENIEVSNGSLKIITRHEYKPNMQYIVSYSPLTFNTSDFDYTSGEIWSKRKFLFGKYEARVKIPKGWGLWPAFWMYGNGHDGNEIDIFEYWNEEDTSELSKIQHLTVHYDYDHDNNVEQSHQKIIHGDMSSDYHVYTLIYLPGYMKWMVDGNTVYEYDRYFYGFLPLNPVGCQLFNLQFYYQNLLFPPPPMNVIFNTAVQHNNGDDPNGNTYLPSQMEVDWFRYYVSADNEIVKTKDIKQQYLNGEVLNAYAAFSVVLDTITIPSDANLSVCALDEVVLSPDFTAEHGSDVNIFILPEPSQQMTHSNTNRNQDELQISTQQYDLSDISVYPNPTSEKITISCSERLVGNGEILIFTTDGKMLSRNMITATTSFLDLSQKKGIYILAVRDSKSNKVASYKLVVK